jgi:diacylglycerol kinase family enzyme
VGGNGKGKRLANEIVLPMLEFAGVEVTVLWTEYSGHAEEIGRTAELAGVDALVAMGGDGTLSEVVTGYLQRAKQPACPLGFVPSGTGNTVLHEVLGEPTVGACETGVRAAVAAIIGGRTRRVDAQRLEMTSVDGTSQKTRYSINTVAAGFAAEGSATKRPNARPLPLHSL